MLQTITSCFRDEDEDEDFKDEDEDEDEDEEEDEAITGQRTCDDACDLGESRGWIDMDMKLLCGSIIEVYNSIINNLLLLLLL